VANITKALVMKFMAQALEHRQHHEREYDRLLARTLGLMAKAAVIPSEPNGNYHNARQRLKRRTIRSPSIWWTRIWSS
jgi:hypothetical protein